MSYIDGLIFAVPTVNKQAFIDYAKRSDSFLQGYIHIGYGWEDEIPSGQINNFRQSVLAKEDESVVFVWVEWPDKATRDREHKMMQKRLEVEGKFIIETPPFDGVRMISGGFETILEIS